MALIFSASTQLGAPSNTSHFFRPILHWLFPAISEATFDKVHHVIRKSAHFTEYAMLGVLAWRVVRFDPAFSSFSVGRKFRLALLFCILYASSDEFHQSFVPTRDAAVLDVMLDSCGSGFGLLAIWVVRKFRASS
jgi:VanZ family protein